MKTTKKILLGAIAILTLSTGIVFAEPNNTPQSKPAEAPKASQVTPQTKPEATKPTTTPQNKPAETSKASQVTPQTKPEATKPTTTPQNKPAETSKPSEKTIARDPDSVIEEIMNKKDIKIIDRNNRQFIKFSTVEGTPYYLVIDYDEMGYEMNIKLLKEVEGNDISDLSSINNKTKNSPGENKENKQISITNNKNNKTKNSPGENNEKTFLNKYGIYIIVVGAVLFVGLSKIKKKKTNAPDGFYNYEEEDKSSL